MGSSAIAKRSSLAVGKMPKGKANQAAPRKYLNKINFVEFLPRSIEKNASSFSIFTR